MADPVAVDVMDLVAAALSGAAHQESPERLSGVFLQEVVRTAADEGLELSEEDYIQLLHEAAALEVSARTAEHVRNSLEACLGKASPHSSTFRTWI